MSKTTSLSSQNFTMTKRHYTKTIDSTYFFIESFRPLATSTPYDIQQSSSSHTFIPNSPHQQRAFLTPPISSSTPKQTRHQSTSSSIKRKLPIVISQRQLQFTTNSTNKTKRMTIKNVKIWLL